MEIEIISTTVKLEAFCLQASGQRWLAVDTEFMREDTYYPKLCLIQIATETRIVCIDALIIDDLSALNKLLASRTVLKVFHAARQDLEIFFMHSGEVPAPVFDTQIAASALGYGDQVSYAHLVSSLCGVNLDKSLSRSMWAQRPLPAQAIRYAANDVRYLSQVFRCLEQELADCGRSHWVESECLRLSSVEQYHTDPDTSWKSVKSAGKLGAKQLVALKWLASWRERQAMERDRPRQWIMRDETLHELAVKQPADISSLTQVESLSRKQRSRHADALLNCICRARQTPKRDWPSPLQRPALTRGQRKTLKRVRQFIQERAEELQVTPNFLASRSMLEQLVRDPESPHALQGWRQSLIGKDLERILVEE